MRTCIVCFLNHALILSLFCVVALCASQLHRKLSGAFLTCRKLEAKIQCKDDFMRLYKNYQFGPELPLVYGSASKDSVESRLKPDMI